MARTWRTERTTPKQPRQSSPRPRMSDFAREMYQDKGYTVDTVTGPVATPCKEPGCDAFGHCESCFTSAHVAWAE